MATQLVPPTASAAPQGPTIAQRMRAADADGSASTPQTDFAKKVQFFFLIVSLYGMMMLVMIPCWNCIVLLRSWVYTQLIGAKAPLTFLLLLFAVVGFFFFSLMLFFRSTHVEVQTFQTIVMMGSAILTLLGVLFMLFGHQLSDLAVQAQKDVEHNCMFAKMTEPLYVESKVLYALRFHPECAAMTSVEQCTGFQPRHESWVLKALEVDFKCSAFCTKVEMPSEDYPTTLFSKASYKPSCTAMLRRNLKYYVQDMGIQAYFQGCMLVLTAAAIGFLKLLGFCIPLRRPLAGKAPGAAEYGSTRYVSAEGILS